MNGGRQPLGYTIIEVMIVLAVSGVMFVIAANFINGKQARTAFAAGVNETASQLQDLIDQVRAGKYSDIQVNCNSTGQGGAINFPNGNKKDQGENPECVFLGKIIHFSLDGDPAKYEIISVAASRFDSSGNPGTTPNSAGAEHIPGLTTKGTTYQQARVRNIAQNATTSTTLSYAIGFLQSQGSTDPSAGTSTLVSGSQNVSMYYVDAVSSPNESSIEGKIKGKLLPTNYANLCITDGRRYAEIILGGRNNQLSVNVKMDGTTKPAVCP